ncbi:MAG: tetratricopeptide repeat protein [Candidatus Schekmanbacteria bacterium]|nr:tetratricopeptide repeat protein [Candidatus Schekmanbacteria bacterium]
MASQRGDSPERLISDERAECRRAYEIGILFLEQGLRETAAEYLKQALQIDPDHVLAKVAVARLNQLNTGAAPAATEFAPRTMLLAHAAQPYESRGFVVLPAPRLEHAGDDLFAASADDDFILDDLDETGEQDSTGADRAGGPHRKAHSGDAAGVADELVGRRMLVSPELPAMRTAPAGARTAPANPPAAETRRPVLRHAAGATALVAAAILAAVLVAARHQGTANRRDGDRPENAATSTSPMSAGAPAGATVTAPDTDPRPASEILIEHARLSLGAGDFVSARRYLKEAGDFLGLDARAMEEKYGDLYEDIATLDAKQSADSTRQRELVDRLWKAANIYYKKNEHNSAEKLLLAILNEDPSHGEAANMLERVRAIRRDPSRLGRSAGADDDEQVPLSVAPATTTDGGTALSEDLAAEAARAATVDDQGHDAVWWANQKKELQRQRDRLRREVHQAKTEATRARSAGDEQRFQSLTARRKELEMQLASAERELTELPDEASRAGALPEWVR